MSLIGLHTGLRKLGCSLGSLNGRELTPAMFMALELYHTAPTVFGYCNNSLVY